MTPWPTVLLAGALMLHTAIAAERPSIEATGGVVSVVADDFVLAQSLAESGSGSDDISLRELSARLTAQVDLLNTTRQDINSVVAAELGAIAGKCAPNPHCCAHSSRDIWFAGKHG